MTQYLKRTARVDDVVEKSGQQYIVRGVEKTHGGRVYLLDVESASSGLPNAFAPREVNVLRARDAAHYREQYRTHRVAKREQAEREFDVQLDEYPEVDDPAPRVRDLDMSDVYADAQRMQDEQAERDEFAAHRRAILLVELPAAIEAADAARARAVSKLEVDVQLALASHPLTRELSVRDAGQLARHIALTIVTSDESDR